MASSKAKTAGTAKAAKAVDAAKKAKASKADNTAPAPDLAHAQLAAYKAVRDRAAAVDITTAPPYILDAVYAFHAAITAANHANDYRAPIADLIDIKHLDDLTVLADALMHVHSMIVARSKRVSLLAPQAEEGYQLRALLMAYGEALALTKAINPEVLVRLKDGSGYHDLVEDLGALADLYTHTPGTQTGVVTQAHINRAAELVKLMGSELATKDDSDKELAALILERRQIAALLMAAHRQVRRAMNFIRDAEEDANEIVPALRIPSGPRASTKEIAAPVPVPVANHPAAPTKSTDPRDNPFDDQKD